MSSSRPRDFGPRQRDHSQASFVSFCTTAQTLPIRSRQAGEPRPPGTTAVGSASPWPLQKFHGDGQKTRLHRGERLETDTAATIVRIAPRAFRGFGAERPALRVPMGMLPAVRATARNGTTPTTRVGEFSGGFSRVVRSDRSNAELRAISEVAGNAFGVRRSSAVPSRSEAYGAYCLAAATIFRSMTFLAVSIAGSSVSRRVGVPFSFRNCWMYESS